MRKILGQILMVMLLAAPLLAAKDKYGNPDSPEVERAARKALSSAVIKDIIGVSKGIEGMLSDLEARVSEHEIRIELAADVLFDFDKSDIRPDASERLNKIVSVIEAYPKSPILIEGHTDRKGSDAYNLKLAEQRAQSVKKWIVMHGGVQAARITTRGWGAAKPVAPNTTPDGKDNPAGRQKNRRVEITIRK